MSEVKNLTASIRQRLLNQAHQTNRPYNEILQYFAIERFLYRISQSRYSDRFVLKGALMFLAWGKSPLRPTRDIDFLGFTPNDIPVVEHIFMELCDQEVEPDGLVFDLSFTLNVYDYSVKRQQIAAKKVYCIDTGLANAVGFAFTANTGKLLENLVFLALRRKTSEIYYYTTPAGFEVDFYLPEPRQLIQAIQSLDQPAAREREVRALVDGMRSIPEAKGLILADANLSAIEVDGSTVEIRSLAEWLLENS
jgi:hypothetical protein